jgi:BCCT family betaine/carnitine transporter
MQDSLGKEPQPDWPVFLAALSLLVLVCIPLFLLPQQSETVIQWLYSGITLYLGIFYLWGGVAVLAFCIWIAASRHGRIKLGDPQSKPQFTIYSWASMLFCAGVATGVLYWGTIEWTYYYDTPPFGVEPRSAEAVRWASIFGVFHWGPTGWAFYCLPALAIGHAYHARGIPRRPTLPQAGGL